MICKTSIWAVTAGLLVVLSVAALGLFGPLTTAAPLDQPSGVITPQAQPASSSPWRSSGPYGGVAQALALSLNFANDGLALAGGRKTGRVGMASCGPPITAPPGSRFSQRHPGANSRSWIW